MYYNIPCKSSRFHARITYFDKNLIFINRDHLFKWEGIFTPRRDKHTRRFVRNETIVLHERKSINSRSGTLVK